MTSWHQQRLARSTVEDHLAHKVSDMDFGASQLVSCQSVYFLQDAVDRRSVFIEFGIRRATVSSNKVSLTEADVGFVW